MATIVNNPYTFDPTQISGCRLWLDANDPASIIYSSGTSVSQWNDKSGYRNNVSQATASNQPTISANYVNGKSAMLFTPNQWVQGSISIETYTRFLVYSNSVVNVGAAVMDGAGFLQNGGGTTYQDAVGYFNPPPSFQTGSFFRIAEAYFPSTGGPSGRIWIDGTEYTSLPYYAPSASYTFSSVAFGRRGDGIYFTGAVAEAILFNRSLTTSEMNMMEGYLAYKYGIQSRLPSNHPYRTAIVQTLLPNQASSIPNPIFVDWSPTQISGCQLWLDATDSTSVTLNTSNVTQWSDKSGNARHLTQSTLSNSPNYTKVNSNYMIDFVRANKTYLINASYSQIYTNFTLYMIIKRKAAPVDTERIFVAIPVSYATDWNTQTGFSFSSTIELAANGSGSSFSESSNLNVTMYSIVTSTNSANVYKNADTTSVISRNLGLTGNSIGILLGSGTNGGINTVSEQFNGYIGEVILFTTALTTTQRQQIEGYLALKWGLQPNLPNSHPYKTQVPIKSGPNINSLSVGSRVQWLPTRISGCQLWLDGADTTSFTLNGGSITQWNDKSGNGNHAQQGTLANSPTLSSSNVNFNGSQWFTTSITSAPTAESFFIVLNTSKNDTIDIFAGTSSGFREVILYNTNIYVGKFGTAPTGLNGGLISTNTRLQFNYQFTTSVLTFSVSGSVTASGTPPFTFTGSGTSYIGSSTYSPNNFVGSINEIVYFNSSLTFPQRQQVEGYLAWKWGLQSSLPSTHPFAKWPPPP